ncbi:MAG: glutamate--cysteine ligase [Gammaproteobacteria bacterium]|nr:glutamate--cysteine ligase [Gammaproteobacteria bacterium]
MSIKHINAVPHLTTALSGPLYDIESHLLTYQAKIESWFRSHWLETPAPFYASVDLRNAGFKLAPVDTNLFPAGFNNLNPAFMPLCIQAVQSVLERICPKAVRILLIPESHTRNQFYLESLATLQEIITKAGFDIRIGNLNPELEENQSLDLPSGKKLLLEPIKRQGNRLTLENYDPCLVLLNNDLSSGRPEILDDLEQMILPPVELGWNERLKSEHFAEYQKATREFCEMVDIDPWLITPMFRNCGEINFMKREGEDCLAKNVEGMLAEIQQKYDEYNIDKPPFVIIKADSGTYGMGIMTVHSADDVRELNRKQRTKMSASKGGQTVSDVIIQEGIYTFETWGDEQAVAEPVVYMLDHYVVGGFYRVHTGRTTTENLNAPGMHFEPLAFAETCNAPDSSKSPDADPNRFYAYGVIARLALLAAAREHAKHQ